MAQKSGQAREETDYDHVVKDFGGVNTRDSRTVIGENDFGWLENVFPIAYGNLRAVPYQGSPVVSGLPSTIYFWKYANLSQVDYLITFHVDGSARAINLATYAATVIGAAGTFSGVASDVAQWKNDTILIIDSVNGYFSWDGTTLAKYTNTVFSVLVTNTGQGFTGVPSIGFGGPGAGASATPIVGMVSATSTAAGTGYFVGDILNVTGGTSTVVAQLKVTAIGATGNITGISLLTQGNYTVTPGTTLTVAAKYSIGLDVGYTPADVLTLIGGTFSTAAQITVDTVDGAGSILTSHITRAGAYTVLPANPVGVTGGTGINASFVCSWGTSVTGGLGTGATFTFKWGLISITVTAGGSGFTSTPNVTITGGGGVGATATAVVTGSLPVGTAIATFSGRVWQANNRTVGFSAPDSYTDFSVTDSGGSFIISDETLISQIFRMIPANNFLYVFGSTSVNVISDVRVGTGVPPPTLFSDTNISAQVGSPYQSSVFVFNRAILFATKYGFHVLSGVTPQKVSDYLDGIFPFIDFTKPITGGTANLFGNLCACFCFTYNDPALGPRALIAVLYQKKWYFCSQGNSLSLVVSGFQSSIPTLFGTDGTNIWKLFSDTTSNISTTVITAMWPLKSPVRLKEAQKSGIEITFSAPSIPPTSFSLTLDSDFGSATASLPLSSYITWINNVGATVQWTNNIGNIVSWYGSGFMIYQGDSEMKGRYLGYTFTSTQPGYTLHGLLMQYQLSTPWPTRAI